MKKSDAAFIAAPVFSVVFTIAYASIIFFRIRVPRYFSLEHTWSYSAQPGTIAQGWYGMFAAAFVIAFTISAIVYTILRTDKFRSRPTILKTVSALNFIIVSLLLVWFVLHEFFK